MTYVCDPNDPCVVTVEIRGYRECSLPIAINGFNFVPMTQNCPLPVPLEPWPVEVETEITPTCPQVESDCVDPASPIRGIVEWYYSRRYDICNSQNCLFELTYSACCRNWALTSVANGGATSMYVGNATLNTNISPCNNSPQFSNPPVPFVCQGQPFTFNQGATDPDGDSLAYSLGDCFQGPNNPVQYNLGYSAQNPLGPSWQVSINPVSGDITMLPVPGNIEVGLICVFVEEWRNINGVPTLINTIVRDAQVTVIPCNNVLPSSPGITNLTAGNQIGPWEMSICAGVPFSFDLPTVDPDLGQSHTFYWNENLAPLGATFENGSQQDTILGVTPTGTFSWTPALPGTYTATFTVWDDACPYMGFNQYTVIINVVGGFLNPGIQTTLTGCTNVNLAADPGTSNTGPYSYQWTGDGNLNQNPNANQQSLTHTYPGPGSYNVQLEITDGQGCTVQIDDVVVIASGPTADAGPDVTLCSGEAYELGAAPITGQTYQWNPSPGLSDPNASNPTFSMLNTGASPVTYNFAVYATSGFCTAVDYVTVVVNPAPVGSITGDPNICPGDAATLTASGGTSYQWSTGSNTASISVSPSTTTTYSVIPIANGCLGQPVPFTVAVLPEPTAIIVGEDSVCPGQDVDLTAYGGTSWQWSTGDVGQTISLANVTGSTTVTVIPSENGCVGDPVPFLVDVYPLPVVDFSSTAVCDGNATEFMDLSQPNSGSISSWTWDFGDPSNGNGSTSQNPSHIYANAGTYQASLTVQSSQGCLNSVSLPVVVNALPEVDFEAGKICDGEVAAFSDQSLSNAGISSWSWDFDGLGASNNPNPSFAFPNPGPYNVSLEVSDLNGCTSTGIQTVFVHPIPVPDFSWENLCFNSSTEFTSLSSLNDPYGTTLDLHEWSFGDPASGPENSSNAVDPSHGYASSGAYPVSLTVTSSQGCSASLTQIVDLEAFSLPVQGATVCAGFGGRLEAFPTGPSQVPVWFLSANGGNALHTGNVFDAPPTASSTVYWVAVVDEEGCFSNRTPVFLNVHPRANIAVSIGSYEADLPNAIVEFSAEQLGGDPIAAWNWSFGDGGASNAASPVHQYVEEGLYDVSLQVQDVNGCSQEFAPGQVRVNKFIALFVPNAFTPNGDGINDVFRIETRLFTDLDIQIFDRWGKLIFESGNLNFEWPGTDARGEPAAEGVYTYKIIGLDFVGETHHRAGTVTLFR